MLLSLIILVFGVYDLSFILRVTEFDFILKRRADDRRVAERGLEMNRILFDYCFLLSELVPIFYIIFEINYLLLNYLICDIAVFV